MNNQYKNQLSSVTLSDDFKASLKERMAAEVASHATTVIREDSAKINWNKYSRYIACAACLVMVIATVSVMGVFNSGMKADKSNEAAQDSFMASPEANGADNGMLYDIPVEEYNDTVAEEATEDSVEVDKPVESNENSAVPTVESEEAETEEEVEADEDDVHWEEPLTNEFVKSGYAPENYDGDYFAEDYVYINEGSGNVEALSIWESADTDISYNSVCENILKDYESVAFVKFDVLEVMSSDAADSITEDEDFSAVNSLYRASLTYDYLTNDSADGEIFVSMVGNSLVQEKGMPMFEEGDTVLACLAPENGYYKMVDQLIYEVQRVNSIDIAYHLLYENVDPGYTDMGILDMERSVVTSTSNNPAEYTNKAAVKELSRYIKRNFKKREIGMLDMTGTVEELPVEVPETDNDIGETIVDDPIQEGGLSIPAENILITVSNKPIGIGTDASELTSISVYAQRKTLENGNAALAIGSNMIHMDNPVHYSGKIIAVEINENGGMLPFKLNNISVGTSWPQVISSLGIDISPEANQICDVDVIQEGMPIYRITFTVENGIVAKIFINGLI